MSDSERSDPDESEEQPVRWAEVDRWGTRVTCAEAVWARKTATRLELVAHEAAVRETVRDPDRLYLDTEATFSRRLRTGRQDVEIMHYVSEHRTQGRQAGNFVVVVVKWLGRSSTTGARGYVTTALLPGRLKSGLHLLWERPE